jgi:hypothetical protein
LRGNPITDYFRYVTYVTAITNKQAQSIGKSLRNNSIKVIVCKVGRHENTGSIVLVVSFILEK